MSFQNQKGISQSQAKRSSLEDAIRAANLDNYVFSKTDEEASQSTGKTPSKNSTNKTPSTADNNWNALGQVSSNFNFTSVPKGDSTKSAPKESNNVSALFALFQKEIDDIEKEDSPPPQKEESRAQTEQKPIFNLDKKKKKTRWEKPIAIPQMTNTNLLNNQQPPMMYNTTNFVPSGLYQNPALSANTQLPFGGMNFGGNNLIGPNNGTRWGGFANTAPNVNTNMYNNQNNGSNNPDQQQSKKGSVESYIVRAFEKCQNEKERQLTEKALKKILNNARIRGDYDTRNWDTFPLPTITTASAFSANINDDDYDGEHANIGPVKVGSLLAKRGFHATNETPRLEIGVNAKGKKVIKTLNKAAAKAKTMELTREEEDKRKQRQGRFHEDLARRMEIRTDDVRSYKLQDADIGEEGDYDLEDLAEKWRVVGTSTALEKPYLRLTKEPDPSLIRPEHILKKSLKLVLEKWKNKEVQYPYVAEQFRSIRQDLTVQHIKNDFTVKVYESNARISLECHDAKYFNQCISWLRDLYGSDIPSKNKPEFLCYRIIHLTLCQMKNDINQLLQELTNEELSHPFVKFALELRRHMENGNVKGVFNLYKNGINLTSYLVDIFIHRVRIWALQIITKSFGDKTPVDYLTDLLAFDTDDDLKEFIKKSNGILTEEEDNLVNKESYKIYSEHPWLKMKLLNFRAAHG